MTITKGWFPQASDEHAAQEKMAYDRQKMQAMYNSNATNAMNAGLQNAIVGYPPVGMGSTRKTRYPLDLNFRVRECANGYIVSSGVEGELITETYCASLEAAGELVPSMWAYNKLKDNK